MNRQTLIISFLLFLSGCAVWPLGNDPTGREYRAQANTVIDAIIQYQKENGELPETLEILVPNYISELPEVVNHSFYSKEKRSLTYNYSPSWPQPGQISCGKAIGSGKWWCHGYI